MGLFGRQMFHYETPEDGGGGGGGGGESSWSPTPEWGQRIDQFIDGAAPVLTQLNEILSAPDDQSGFGGQFDPGYGVDPYEQWQRDYAAWQAQYGDQLNGGQQAGGGFDPSMIQQVVEQAMSPYAPMLQTMAERQGEEYANQMLTQLEGEVGSFDREQALTVAQALLAQGVDPQQALREAAKMTHEFQEQVKQAAIEEYKATLTRQAEATGDLGAGGSAIEMPGTPRGSNRYEEVIARALSGVHTPS